MSNFDALVAKLREIFQIDRPDLDFGVYVRTCADHEHVFADDFAAELAVDADAALKQELARKL